LVLAFVVSCTIPSFAQDSGKNLSNNSFSHLTFERPVIRSIQEDQLQRLETHRVSATIQFSIPTSHYDKDKDPLSYLMYRLPDYFPAHNIPAHRRVHSTFLHLDDLSLEELREVAWFLSNIPASVVERFGLNRRFKIYDGNEKPKFRRVGVESVFLALEPPREEIEFQVDFYRAVQFCASATSDEVSPRMRAAAKYIVDKHLSHFPEPEKKASAFSDTVPHYSLVQLRRKSLDKGSSKPSQTESLHAAVSEDEFNRAASKVGEIIESANQRYRELNQGRSIERFMSLETNPLEVVVAPRSRGEEPLQAFALKMNSRSEWMPSSVLRFFVPASDVQENSDFVHTEIVEFYTDKLLADGEFSKALSNALVPWRSDINAWSEPRESLTPANLDGFLSEISDERLRSLYLRMHENREISPSQLPAVVEVNGRRVFVTNQVKGTIAFDKGNEQLSMARELITKADHDPKSPFSVSFGYSLYASRGDRVYSWSGDTDIAIGILVHIPENLVLTTEQRDEYVAQALEKEFIEVLLRKAEGGEIAIIELRAGSARKHGSGGNPINDIDDAYFFSEIDLKRGFTIDPATKNKIYLREVLRENDWIKGKFEYVSSGEQFSIQLNVGSDGTTELGYRVVVPGQRDAIKGIPPLTRGGKMLDAESMAVFTALHSGYMVHAVQKGSMAARAGSEVHSAAFAKERFEPIWNAKGAKKTHSLEVFFSQGGTGFDEIGAVRVIEILKFQNALPEELGELIRQRGIYAVLDRLKNTLRSAFNQPTLGLLSSVRRTVNDLREYNERGHEITEKMWRQRQAAVKEVLPKLKSVYQQHVSQDQISQMPEFEKAQLRFENVMDRLGRLPFEQVKKELIKPAYYRVFRRFESQLTELDRRFILAELSGADRVFASTLIRYFPFIYLEYIQSRKQTSDQDFLLEVQLLGVEPTQENIARLRDVKKVFTLSPASLERLEMELFGVGFREDNSGEINLEKFAADCNDVIDS